MNKSLMALCSIAVIAQLNACTPTTQPNSPNVLQANTAGQTLLTEAQIFQRALSKRDIETSVVTNSSTEASSGSAGSSVSIPAAPMPAPSAAPSAMPFPMGDDISAITPSSGYGYTSPGYGYFPGGDFNTYVPLRAEELKYAGNTATNLQTVYKQTLMPMLQEWDSTARLLEARGNTRPEHPEYIDLPDDNSLSPRQFKANWVFRFSSSVRKETLTVYINSEETLAYRIVYGEPSLDIQKVTITSDKALEIAKAAFKNKSENGSDRIDRDQPMASSTMDPSARVFYDLPQDLNWRTVLTQQGGRLVYTLSFDWQTTRTALGLTKIEMPTPVPTPVDTPRPQVTPTPTADYPVAEPYPYPMTTPPPGAYYCGGPVDESVYLSGYITLDAMSGKVLSLNRPVYYDNQYNSGYGCAYGGYGYGGSYGYGTIYPDGYAGPTPLPSATSDI